MVITNSGWWDGLPEDVRVAALATVTHWYENRTPGGALPAGALSLLDPWRRYVI